MVPTPARNAQLSRMEEARRQTERQLKLIDRQIRRRMGGPPRSDLAATLSAAQVNGPRPRGSSRLSSVSPAWQATKCSGLAANSLSTCGWAGPVPVCPFGFAAV